MPATGRSYYPNVPGSLEEALASSVAAGTSPWAPILMMNARNERRAAITDVNETQANQYLTGLQAALQQEKIKAGASIIGEQLRGGHAVGPAMTAANTGGYTQYDPNDIATETLLNRGSEVANVGKTIADANYAGAQAGVRPDLSQLAAGLGLPTVNSTPIATQGHEIAAGATLGAARINADAKRYATDHKKPSGSGSGGGPKLEYTGTSPLGGNVTLKGVPPTAENMGKYLGEDTAAKIMQGQATTDLTGTSSVAPSGDSIQRDPELPHILAAIASKGAKLVGADGNARYATNKQGKRVVVTDVVLPDGTHTTAETPTARQ